MATYFIDLVASMRHDENMLAPMDAVEQIKQQLISDRDRLVEIRSQMEDLRAAYTKFQNLREELENRRARIQKLIAVLGPEMFKYQLGESDWALGDELNGVYGDSPDELREKLTVWKAIEAFISVAGESRVADIQHFFDLVEINNVSRQAIESAINRHPETFAVTRRNRERYIRLKKAK